MKRTGLGIVVIALASLMVGAKGQSCSAEIDPGDGSAAGWKTGQVPSSSTAAAPMSCEWMKSDNCWKRLMTKALACSKATADVGTFASDRHSCSFSQQGRWEFEGDVATPGSRETHFPLMNWRTLDAAGEPCVTSKSVGLGRTVIDVQGEAVLFENTGLTTHRLTCADGTTFTNDSRENPGVCGYYAGEWLAHRAPGLIVVCEGTPKQCRLELWGGPTGLSNAAVCGW